MCGERPDNEITATEGTRRPTPDAEAWGGDARMLRDTADRSQPRVTATVQIIWTARPDGRMDDLRGWRAYTGQGAVEVAGWGWREAIHPHDQERITLAWSEARAAGVLFEVEARLRRSDGVYGRFLVRGVPVLDAEGGIREWVGVCTAITTRARSAAALEAILDTALDAIVTMDHQGRIVEFNAAAERIFGYSRADALDHALADLIVPPDLRARHWAGLTAYLATGEGALIGRRSEIQAMRRDGSLFPAEVAITRIALEGPPLFVGYIRDITARTRAEEDRARALQRERDARVDTERARAEAEAQAAERDAVFEAMADGVLVVNRDGTVLRMNAAYRLLMGIDHVPPDQGSTHTLHERRGFFIPRDTEGTPLPAAQWPVARILRGERLTGARTDIMARTLDGRDILLGITGAPLHDRAGRIVGGVCICRDVTERRRMERRTHEALDALVALAEAVVGGADATRGGGAPVTAGATLTVPDQGATTPDRLVALIRHVLSCPRVGLMGVTPALDLRPLAYVGLALGEEEQWRARIAHVARQMDVRDILAPCLLGGETLLVDTARPAFQGLATPGGSRAYVLAPLRVGVDVVGVLWLDDGRAAADYTPDDLVLAGTVARLAALVLEQERLQRDWEEARASAATLRAANRHMDEFLGIAGHEMRTPLTSIMGNIQVTQRRLARLRDRADLPALVAHDVDEARDVLARGDAGLRRLNVLIDDLLDVSRIHAGRLRIRPQPCDLVGIVRDALDEQRQANPTRTIHLEAPDHTSIPVDADAGRIGQVVTNYLSNALKYSGEDQPVTVGLGVEGATARVWVRDTGPGIAPDDQERIWERFYRVEGIAHRHGSSVGLGLGLHISRTIIAQHEGQVGVDSVRGAGTTFWFVLPLARPL